MLCPQHAAACVSLSKSTMSKTRPGCPCPPFSARCRRGAAYLVAPFFRVNRLLSKHSGFFGSRRSGAIRSSGGASLDDVAQPSQPVPLFGTNFLDPDGSRTFRTRRRAASILRSLNPSQSAPSKQRRSSCSAGRKTSVPARSGASSRSAIPPSTDHLRFPPVPGRGRSLNANRVKGRREASLFSIRHRVD